MAAVSSEAEIPTVPPEATLVKYNSPLTLENPDSVVRLSRTEELLNQLIPRRMWISNEKLKAQYVSSTPATTADVKALEANLNRQLRAQGAESAGICRVRSKINEQCFDELIRQITIMCAARGKLLQRVHVEIRRRIETYKTLYESSNAYGIRSALKGSFSKETLAQRAADLKRQTSLLETAIEAEQAKRERLEAEDQARSLTDKTTHEAAVKKEKEEYTQMMEKYKESVAVSFEDKKKRRGRR